MGRAAWLGLACRGTLAKRRHPSEVEGEPNMTRDCLLCSQNARCHLEVRKKVWTIDVQGKGSGIHMPQRRGGSSSLAICDSQLRDESRK